MLMEGDIGLLISWLPTIITGAVAGWAGSLLFKGKGSGVIINILLGIGGAYVGTRLFNVLDIDTTGIVRSLLSAAVGAFVILWVFRMLFGRRSERG